MTGNTSSTDDLLNLAGIRQRIDSYLFDLVDLHGSRIGDVKPIRDSPAKIENLSNRTMYRTLTNFNLDANEQADLVSASARVRPRLVLQNGESFSLGVFLFGDATRPRRSWGQELAGTLVDQRYILAQSVGRSVGYDAGTDIVAAATALAQEVITGTITATPSTVTLSQPLGWKIEDARVKIIEDLMLLIGYLPPYFDNNGSLVLRPVPAAPFSASVPAYEAGGRIVKDSIIETDDLLKAPNRYIAIESGASASPITGTYDLPASAPNSITARGFAVVKTLIVQGLADAGAAANAAQAAANSDINQFRQVQFESTHDPRHDTFDVISLLGDLYREVGWSVDLRAGGRMHHNLRRVYT